MSRSRGMLHIVLKSDLCAGCGDGFSSGVDIDVCYDKSGLPFITGRRLKGCLREAALLMGCRHVDQIFGVTGERVAGSIRVDDATLPEADRVVSRDAQTTLERYAYVRAKTAIDGETGAAKEGTLRFERVVKHWLPADSGKFKETEFVAPLWIDDRYKDEVELAARALRNMGLNRNRGLGAVRCRVEWGCEEAETDGRSVCRIPFDEDGRQMVAISYRVRLDAPVMLATTNSNRSETSIPGTSVLGSFAGSLRDKNCFDELFLSGKVRFSALYPVDKHGARCLPAPSFVVRVKGGVQDGCYLLWSNIKAGQTAKALREGFVGSDWLPVPVKTEIGYHHNRQDDGGLYTQQFLCAGQVFAGFVECPKANADDVLRVLDRGSLSFGRSKSAQYARCSIVSCGVDYACRKARVTVRPKGTYALLLDSDVLLVDEKARPTASLEALRAALSEPFGRLLAHARLDVDEHDGIYKPATSLRYRTVGGYNAKRNQKKAHVRVIAAGSCLVFDVDKDIEAFELPVVGYVGQRQSEGFGRVRLIDLDSIVVEEAEDALTEVRLQEDFREGCRQNVIGVAFDMRAELGALNTSFVGRLALMVRESTSQDDLRKRFKDIDDQKKQAQALRYLNKVDQSLGDGADWQLEKECLALFFRLAKSFCKQRGSKKEVA